MGREEAKQLARPAGGLAVLTGERHAPWLARSLCQRERTLGPGARHLEQDHFCDRATCIDLAAWALGNEQEVTRGHALTGTAMG
jgi:hypothetical protein